MPATRATWLSRRRAPCELQVEWVMGLAERGPVETRARSVADALGTYETARSRRLIDLISETAIDVDQGSDPRLLDTRQRL